MMRKPDDAVPPNLCLVKTGHSSPCCFFKSRLTVIKIAPFVRNGKNTGMTVDEYVKQPWVSPLASTRASGAAGHCAPALRSALQKDTVTKSSIWGDHLNTQLC